LALQETATGETRLTFSESNGLMDVVALSPDGQWIAAAARNERIRLWHVAAAHPRRSFEGHQGGTYALAFSPDGRTLVSTGRDGTVRLWEIETGTLRRRLAGHRGAVFALAYSPDGRRLASAGEEGKLLLHDLVSVTAGASTWDEDHLWTMLAERDATVAEHTASLLRGSPGKALTLLESRLAPTPPVEAARLQRLLAELDHRRYPVRREAACELTTLGSAVIPALRQSLRQGPSLEVRRRIETILDLIDEAPLTPDERRAVRAIEVLEQLGTAEARRLLRGLSEGAPGAQQTDSARSALRRLGH
jgi:hypothetical protein